MRNLFSIKKESKEKEVHPEAQKVLRVGLIERGKLSQERLFRKRVAVTIGDSHKNSFMLMDTGLPSRFPLFEVRDGAYVLHVVDGMQGRLSLDSGRVVELAEFGSELEVVGRVTLEGQKRAVRRLPLSDRCRGKLRVGERTLLFQFITPPPMPQESLSSWRPRGQWAKGIDWMYASIFTLSFFAHSAFIYWCQMTGPLQARASVGASRFTKHIYETSLPPVFRPKETPKPEERKAPADEGKEKPKPRSNRTKRRRPQTAQKPPKATQGPQDRKSRRQALHRALRNVGILRILGKKGKNSPYENLFRGGEDRLATAIDKVGAVAMSKHEIPRRTRRNVSRTHLTVRERLVGPQIGNTTRANTGQRRKKVSLKRALNRVKIEEIEDLPVGKLDAAKLKRILHRRRMEIIFCYERRLRRAPNLRGKLALRISINTLGRAVSLEVEDDTLRDRTVSACVIRKIKRWRFPRPQEPASLVIPFLFSPQGK